MAFRIALSAVILTVSICAGPSLARADAVVGKITEVSGKAQVKRGTSSLEAAPAMPVELHDQLNTASPGQLTLEMLDKSVLTVNESSVLAIDESLVGGGTATNVNLLSGSVHSLVTAVARAAAPTFKVTTPNAVAGVRGTDFTCRYTAGKSRPGFTNCFEFTDCATTTGTVVVTNNPPRPGVAVKVGPGMKTTVACLAAPLAATPGTLGVLGGSGAGTSSSVLGPAVVVGAGLGAASVISGTTIGIIEATGGSSTRGGTTASPVR